MFIFFTPIIYRILNVSGLKPLFRVIYISLSLCIVNSIYGIQPIESSVLDGSTRSSEVGTKPKTQQYLFSSMRLWSSC